jgi:hypothetical protein
MVLLFVASSQNASVLYDSTHIIINIMAWHFLISDNLCIITACLLSPSFSFAKVRRIFCIVSDLNQSLN